MADVAVVAAAVHIACTEMDIGFDIENLTIAVSVDFVVAGNNFVGGLLRADMSHAVAALDGRIALELAVALEYIEFGDVDCTIHIACWPP